MLNAHTALPAISKNAAGTFGTGWGTGAKPRITLPMNAATAPCV